MLNEAEPLSWKKGRPRGQGKGVRNKTIFNFGKLCLCNSGKLCLPLGNGGSMLHRSRQNRANSSSQQQEDDGMDSWKGTIMSMMRLKNLGF